MPAMASSAGADTRPRSMSERMDDLEEALLLEEQRRIRRHTELHGMIVALNARLTRFTHWAMEAVEPSDLDYFEIFGGKSHGAGKGKGKEAGKFTGRFTGKGKGKGNVEEAGKGTGKFTGKCKGKGKGNVEDFVEEAGKGTGKDGAGNDAHQSLARPEP